MANDLLGQPRSIAILRALQLGDLLCAVPAWRALRASLPKSHIALVGLPWARAFVKRFPRYIDEFIEFPGYPGLPERPVAVGDVPGFLSYMQARHFDLALQMHGSGHFVNEIVMLFGARAAAGFYMPGEWCADESRFLSYPEGVSEIRRHLRLMDFLGVPLQGEELEFPLTPEDKEALMAVEETRNLSPRGYACLHPGGRGGNRRWLPEEFGRVGDALATRGLQVVMTGTAEETDVARTVERTMRSRPINLVGRTDLGALGVLMSRARLLVANDTGVSHIASALRLPSVIVVTGSDPMRWGPFDRRRHRLLSGPTATVASVMKEVDSLLLDEADAAA
ncbi:MAG: glycosyltransferase family 9 protein [Nitrospiraceae bacterium]|nr:glycosyltransferase family 9 protein [Nitrospiraceae bacterium]